MRGLVLSGGGARGAYQVGVLNAIAEIAKQNSIEHPFQVFTGVSAGAINSSFMAAGAHQFHTCTEKLVRLWSELESQNVFRTDAISIGKIGLSWVGELSFGGLTNGAPGRSLLDTSPLGDLIRNNLEFHNIAQNISQGHLAAVGITAMDYQTSTAITFVQGKESSPMWSRSKRKSEKSVLRTEHILASSAIPLLFSPIQVGDRYFGDGCLRNHAPMSPAIHLGATKLVVVGVRMQDKLMAEEKMKAQAHQPSVARVANVLLNAVLLDGVELDVERFNRINEFVNSIPEEHQHKLNFKKMQIVPIHPSRDIGQIAFQMSSRMPRIVRYLLKGLGPLEDAAEIISYLLFEPDFCKALIEMGYEDGMNQKSQLEDFFASP